MQTPLTTLCDYISLTKPKIILLLSVTGMVGYIIPNHKDFTLLNLLFFFLMGFFSAGGAMAVNNYIDRDIDQLMTRTRHRASLERLGPRRTLLFGIALMLLSWTIAYLAFNVATTAFLIWADLFYIFAYSMWLKRTSIWSTIVGGIISPTPVWVGYTAGLGYVPLEGWLLGLIVFVWTPPHTFAMSAKNVEDYTAAGIPMLPVVIGMKQTASMTLIGAVITTAYGLWVYLAFFSQGQQLVSYTILTLISAFFLYTNLRFWREPTTRNATLSFRGGHTVFLAGLFLLILYQNYL